MRALTEKEKIELTKTAKDIRRNNLNTTDMMEGCINRLCVSNDMTELDTMYMHLTLYAAELYQANRKRIATMNKLKSGVKAPSANDLIL